MLITEWGEALDRSAPLPEYPRPQLVRGSYLNLNGPWEYAFTADMKKPEEYAGEIVVPFSPESPLSGVGRTLRAGNTSGTAGASRCRRASTSAACCCTLGPWTSPRASG